MHPGDPQWGQGAQHPPGPAVPQFPSPRSLPHVECQGASGPQGLTAGWDPAGGPCAGSPVLPWGGGTAAAPTGAPAAWGQEPSVAAFPLPACNTCMGHGDGGDMGTWQHPSAGPWGGTGTNPGRETTQICAHCKRAHVCARTRTCLNAHIQRVCAHRRAHVRTRACPTMHTYGAHKHTYAHLAQPHAHRMCPHLQIPTHSTHTRAHTRAHQHTGAHLSANADACTQHTRAHGGTLLSPAPPQPWGKPSPSDTRLNTHVPAAGQPPAICLCVRVSVVARGERRRWR